MGCKRYFEQDNCPYYPTDCDHCEHSYSYTEEDIEVKEEPKVFVVYKGIKIDENKERPVRRQIEVVPFNEELEYLQNLVGGYIEHFIIDDELDMLNIDMWINEEGKFRSDFLPSFALMHDGSLYDVIMGPCVFSKYNDEGETLGLSLNEMNVVIDWLNNQQIGGLISKDSQEADIPVICVSR